MNDVNNVKKTPKRGKGKPFKRGNPGRPKGSINKFTNLKKAYLDVFEKIEKESEKDGSIDNFFNWATKKQRNQGMFYQMISRMLPSNLNVEGDLKVTYQTSEKFMPKMDNEKK